MKAAFIVAPRKFEIKEIDTPLITDDEMLVKIEACGVCSSDMAGYLASGGRGSATPNTRSAIPPTDWHGDTARLS